MFELISITKDNKFGFVFDSKDFSVEKHSMDDIFKYVKSGVEIRGIFYEDKRFHFEDRRKVLIYKDNKFAFFDTALRDNNYSISVMPLNGKYNSISLGYEGLLDDTIQPKVNKLANNIYEIALFGENYGYSICILDAGNNILKPVFRDKDYVSKGSKLILDGINIRREV